jgi:Lhr-like helicase
MCRMSTDTQSTFADLGLRAPLLDALTALGYEEPTPIQQAAIGPLLAGRDLLGQAATGTGKTAAFALPILNRLPEDERGRAPSALILVPTRASGAIPATGGRSAPVTRHAARTIRSPSRTATSARWSRART